MIVKLSVDSYNRKSMEAKTGRSVPRSFGARWRAQAPSKISDFLCLGAGSHEQSGQLNLRGLLCIAF
jgi:hypothetical protein